MMVPASALLDYAWLKQASRGTGEITIGHDDVRFTIPTRGLFRVALERAGGRAEPIISVIETPGIFLGSAVSAIVARTPNWSPPYLTSSTWRTLIYPFFALPAWYFVGLGIDALAGRRGISKAGMVTSLILAIGSAAIAAGFRFGMSASERQGQDRLNWAIEGLALWTILFAIPFVAWLRHKTHGSVR